MCFAADASPPGIPQERVRAVRGDTLQADRFELISADGTQVSAGLAQAPLRRITYVSINDSFG